MKGYRLGSKDQLCEIFLYCVARKRGFYDKCVENLYEVFEQDQNLGRVNLTDLKIMRTFYEAEEEKGNLI